MDGQQVQCVAQFCAGCMAFLELNRMPEPSQELVRVVHGAHSWCSVASLEGKDWDCCISIKHMQVWGAQSGKQDERRVAVSSQG